MKGTFGIDPEQDVAGRMGIECFLCAKPILEAKPTLFSQGPMTPEMPLHLACLHGRKVAEVAAEYHKRIADLVFCPRPS